MSGFNGATLTEKGLLLQSKAQSGIELKMNRIAIGSGGYTGDLTILTELIKEEKILPITSMTLDNGKTKIRTTLDNSDVEIGFYIKEIGLFAQDPDEGEILYAIANSGDGPADYIPPYDSEIVEEIIDINILVGNALNVTAMIDKSIVYPSYEDFEIMKNNYDEEILNYKNIVQTVLHSGHLEMGKIIFDHMEANKIKVEESKVYVNGDFITVTEQCVDCGQGPAADFISASGRKGYREDLVFLEVWKELSLDATYVVIKHRIRVVEDIDFKKYLADGFNKGSGLQSSDINHIVTAQGGNYEPTVTNVGSFTENFLNYVQRNGASIYGAIDDGDAGLYIAGKGTEDSKNKLKTYDGYVYVIPMFGVKRRNNEDYGQDNPNGSIDYLSMSFNRLTALKPNDIASYTLSSDDYTKILVGDTFGYLALKQFKIVSKDGENCVTVKDLVNTTVHGTGALTFYKYPNQPNNKYANVVDESDIVDLRRKVSLDGVNTELLLKQSMNQALAGELAPIVMKKQYMGIKKTPIDSNTVFYASFDGTRIAEVGGELISTAPKWMWDYRGYKRSPTGLAVELPNIAPEQKLVSFSNGNCTVDLWVNVDEVTAGLYTPIVLCSDELSASFKIKISNLAISISLGAASFTHYFEHKGYNHIRVVVTKTSIEVRLNGKKVINSNQNFVDVDDLVTLDFGTVATGMFISDLSISNVDRGDNYLTLPSDFVEGEADIQSAFNGQRQSYSEPMSGQTTVGVAYARGINTSRGLSITQSNGEQWTSGDTIKVKGEAKEIISGLIDANTALIKVIKYEGIGNTCVVDSVEGVSVGDIFNILRVNGELGWGNKTVTAVNSDTNELTFNIQVASIPAPLVLLEVTESTSVPLVNFLDDSSNKRTVLGTWSGLGTNEAKFVLGINTTLADEDIFVDYSLNTPDHEGQIPVYSEVLEGVVKSRKLVKSDAVIVADDFTGGIFGSTLENPNMMQVVGANELKIPTEFTSEISTASYCIISQLNEILYAFSGNKTSVGYIDQHLYSFDLIRIVEDKYGEIIAVDKVQWLRDNLHAIRFTHYGYGLSPIGNIRKVAHWVGSSWANKTTNMSGSVSPFGLYLAGGNLLPTIREDGKVHFLAYSDASDGVTSSILYTDYFNIELTLITDVNFDILAPEDTRRDAGRSNVLLVRKETREIKTLFPASNEDEIAIIGNAKEQYEQVNGTKDITILSQNPYFVVTDLNSANGDKYGVHPWNNLAWRFNEDDRNLVTEFGYGQLPLSIDSKDINTGFLIKICSRGLYDHYVTQRAIPGSDKPMIGLVGMLVEHNQEIKLFIISRFTNNGSMELVDTSLNKGFLLPIKGRPLVKARSGEIRDTLSNPTSWETPTGEVMGYLDANSKVITI